MSLKTEIDVCEIISGMMKHIEDIDHKLDMTQQQLNILRSEFNRHTGFTHTEPILY